MPQAPLALRVAVVSLRKANDAARADHPTDGSPLGLGGSGEGHAEAACIVNGLGDEGSRPDAERGRARLEHLRAPVADGEDAREHRLELHLGPHNLLRLVLILLTLALLLGGLLDRSLKLGLEPDGRLHRPLREARHAAPIGHAHIDLLALALLVVVVLAEHLRPKVGVVQVSARVARLLHAEARLAESPTRRVRRLLVARRRRAPLEDLLNRLGRETLDGTVVLLGEQFLSPVLEKLLDLGRLEAAALARCLAAAALVVVAVGALFRVVAVADDGVLEAKLLVGRVEEVHLVRVTRHEPVDAHKLRLADAVAARLRLQVVLRVPVGVVDDDRVGRGEVDAHAARARAEQEEKGGRAGLAEPVDGGLALVAGDRAVEALVGQALEINVLLDEVEQHRELREGHGAR